MVNPIQITQPQAYSGGADFTPLAKLYDVYKASQQRAMEEAALGRLGDDPTANTRALLTSGVPKLAMAGLDQQQQAIVNARMAEAQKLAQGNFGLAQSQERRVQEEYVKKLRDEAEAAKLFGTIGAAPGGAASSPFPAPLPGRVPQTATPGPQAAAVPQAPPVMAAGDDGGGESGGGPAETGLPAWADPVTARITSNLTSRAPAADVGLSRDQLANLYRNPVTRPLATAILQKQMDPGTYTWQQVGDKLIRTNNKTGEEKVVMTDTKPYTVGGSLAVPDGQGGFKFITPPEAKPIHQKEDEVIHIPDGQGGYKTIGAGNTKAQRELEGNTYKADQLGLTGRKREFFLANGKLPTGEDVPPGDRRRIDKLDDVLTATASAKQTLTDMENLNEQSFKGIGAGARGWVAANVLPSDTPWAKQGQATIELRTEMTRSALNQLKAIFTGSQSKEELAVLRSIQGAIDNPGTVNKNLFKRAREVLDIKEQRTAAQQEAIRTGEAYKPGGGQTAAPAAPAITTAKPSLNDFMTKARAANPGASDGDLARYWKQKYGG
jgi:hypothetical protein